MERELPALRRQWACSHQCSRANAGHRVERPPLLSKAPILLGSSFPCFLSVFDLGWGGVVDGIWMICSLSLVSPLRRCGHLAKMKAMKVTLGTALWPSMEC